MTIAVDIMRIPPGLVAASAPMWVDHLQRGTLELDRTQSDIMADVARGHAQIWAIIMDGESCGAFLTSIREDQERGGRLLDVYGLAGEGIRAWGKQLTARMVAYAKAERCGRIVFQGRPALERVYSGVTPIGQTDRGLTVYERVVQ